MIQIRCTHFLFLVRVGVGGGGGGIHVQVVLRQIIMPFIRKWSWVVPTILFARDFTGSTILNVTEDNTHTCHRCAIARSPPWLELMMAKQTASRYVKLSGGADFSCFCASFMTCTNQHTLILLCLWTENDPATLFPRKLIQRTIFIPFWY